MKHNITYSLVSSNLASEDPEFANECALTEMGQYIESLMTSIRDVRKKRDRQAERFFIKQLQQACIQATALSDDDLYIETFEGFLEECMKDFAEYPHDMRYAMVTGHKAA